MPIPNRVTPENEPKRFRKALLASAVSSCLLGATGAAAQTADDTADLEEIIVRGVRSSLERSLDIKRESEQIVESVTADDIGKMPDQNIAESLQRLTGVQIDRLDGEGTRVRIRGLSQNVTLLNGETFFTGLEYFQLGENRTEFKDSLEGVPSELLGGVDVYKSPVASMVEGGIGGAVNLKTYDAFSLRQPLIAGNLKGNYGVDSEDYRPQGAIVLGNNWDDRFAAILSFSINDKTVHSDESQNINRQPWSFVTLDDGGTPDDRSDDLAYIAPGIHYVTDGEAERERIGGSLTLQYRPTDSLQVGLDWFHSELEIDNRLYTIKYDISLSGASLDTSQPFEIDENNVLNRGVFNQPAAETNTSRQIADIETDNLRLTGKYDNGGRWRLSGELALADSTLVSDAAFSDSRFTPYAVTTWTGNGPTGWEHVANNAVAGDSGNRPYTYVTGDLPTVTLADETPLQDPRFLNFKSHWALGDRADNEFAAARGDAEFDLDFGDFKAVKVGFRLANTEIDFLEGRYLTDLSQNGTTFAGFDPLNPAAPGTPGVPATIGYDLRAMVGDAGCGALTGNQCDIDGDGLDDNQLWGPYGYFLDAAIGDKAFDNTTSNGTPLFEALYGVTGGGRFGGSPGVMPWETYSSDPGRATTLNGFFPSGAFISSALFDDASRMSDPRAWIDSIAPGSPVGFFEEPLESWNVEEETRAVYAEIEVEGDSVPYHLNLGVRVVETDVTVTGAETTENPRLWGTDSWNGSFRDFNVVTTTNSYWDVLPSLNFSLDLNDEQKIRFAVARVLSRPNLQLLGKGFAKQFVRDEVCDCFVFTGGSSGNPNLKPFRATQADVSYEWYLGEVGLVAIGGFFKSVESFTATQTTVEEHPDSSPSGFGLGGVSRPFNGAGGSVKGIELAFQTAFDNGFGFATNYTFSDSETDLSSLTQDNLPIPGVSKHAFNVIGFYENETVSARIAYTWRDEFLSPDSTFQALPGLTDQFGAGGDRPLASWYDPYGQLDASVTWDVFDRFSLVAEVINITEEDVTRYTEFENQFRSFNSQEARYVVGVNFRFGE